PLWRGPSESERRAPSRRHPVEVRVQARQIDREDHVHGEAAAQHVAAVGAVGIRFLRQREPDSRSSALEPGHRASDRRVPPPANADVQRLRSGCVALLGSGPAEKLLIRALKPFVFLLSLGPAAWLIWAALTGNLSANPLSDITNETGVWTLRFVCITLAITPLRRVTGWNAAIRFRRMFGLFAFFYGTLHFLTYVIVDRFAGLDFPDGMVALSTVRNLIHS